MSDKRNITIDDIAKALGISKSTVSRAISGKGRVGEATRGEVLRYIDEHKYVPSAMARGLANQRTYNVGLIMPEDFGGEELPFFQKCLMGICETAHKHDYNVLISMTGGNDNAQIERMIDNRKIDGVLLTRTKANDEQISLLKKREIPFVTIGLYDDDEVVQVDNDNEKACYELTSHIVSGGVKKVALVSQDDSYMVTKLRMQGFVKAVSEYPEVTSKIFMHEGNMTSVLEEIKDFDADCIICMDDAICLKLVEEVKNSGMSIPDDVKVASFYGSQLLDKYEPVITSVSFDSRKLGKLACKTLLDVIEEREYNFKTLLDYKLNITGSL